MRVRGALLAVITLIATLLVVAEPASAATVRQRLADVVVPAYCGMPSQRLHDGKTAKKYLPKAGGIAYQSGSDPISVHLRPQGGTQLLAQYACTAGGVGWPTVLVLYSSTGHLLASVRLAHYSAAEHAQVDCWSAESAHRVKVSWSSYEGAGGDITHHHSVLTLHDGTLRLA